jgi:hypothetical protein
MIKITKNDFIGILIGAIIGLVIPACLYLKINLYKNLSDIIPFVNFAILPLLIDFLIFFVAGFVASKIADHKIPSAIIVGAISPLICAIWMDKFYPLVYVVMNILLFSFYSFLGGFLASKIKHAQQTN